jgi:anti-sigma factor RsiW
MCEFSSKLIAWLDQELPEAEAAAMDQHVPICRECRAQADAFREVSHAFAAYTRAVPSFAAHSSRFRWLVPAAIAAAVFAVFLLSPRRPPIIQPGVQQPAEAVSPLPAVVSRKAPVAVLHPRALRPVKKQPAANLQQGARWQPAEPALQVMIPADALFLPGTLPEGVGFVADLRLAAAGSPGGIASRP